ncbi:hypothetical protein [Methylobacterium gnaphalii]|uniref:Uncharacterized protein n=1 Tax=Methylobacterium gnaphalii TaxID=1010610 RepID=A0A512JR98_9HYPH|nr:hypothetical protein [Methylobacterium gnaphalii]GEP12479.1 hypothetical protein MGN01_43240 [Methylobacterium gnaphalii]GJD71434.1 hypothetical protein MMMDOFMJ_4393 [Methylobacterium gnaphalii]GLS50599.1 hypothetical protein GCM10007885_34520 [Methylobacterium gnaphalii]
MVDPDFDSDSAHSAMLSTIGIFFKALQEKGAIDATSVIDELRQTAVGHRQSGFPKSGNLLGKIADYLETAAAQTRTARAQDAADLNQRS